MNSEFLKNKKMQKAFVVVGVVFSLIGGWYAIHKIRSSKKDTVAAVIPEKAKIKMAFSMEVTNKAAAIIKNMPVGKTPQEKKAHEYFMKTMGTPVTNALFYKTLEFFKFSKGAVPAAKFVSLSMIFDNSPEKVQLMGTTMKELKQNSAELMATLEGKRNEIYDNPYFHNRMLNLANLLQVDPQRKLNFLSDTVQKPLEVNSAGLLTDSSQTMEVALILAKSAADASGPNASMPTVTRMIASAIAANPQEPQKTLLKERVLSYFPRMGYLFR